jgi:hypothetical protein
MDGLLFYRRIAHLNPMFCMDIDETACSKEAFLEKHGWNVSRHRSQSMGDPFRQFQLCNLWAFFAGKYLRVVFLTQNSLTIYKIVCADTSRHKRGV